MSYSLDFTKKAVGYFVKLKHQLTGLWSRRINKEHRIIYEINEYSVLIHSARGHYTK